ncbi:hypothetical protein K1719_000756 [Acacia pycnantha]|nr:hypothetical protein K1719_000756 [Acacia pycnantha]
MITLVKSGPHNLYPQESRFRPRRNRYNIVFATSFLIFSLALLNPHLFCLFRMVRKRIPNIPVFTLKTPNLDSGSNLKAHATTSPISNKKTISSSQYKTIFLHDWWLVKPQGKGLAVEGVASMERLGERVISSSPIAKRHETNVLETQDGITFFITGFINKSRTNENGFSFEVCRRFLLGFPHDWEEYLCYGVGEQHDNGNTGLDDSSTCPLKNVSEIADSLTNKGDLNCSLLLKKLLNDSVGTSPLNVSEQSEPGCNREPNIRMNTKECQGTEDTNLGTSNVQVDQMHNIENVGSDVIFEAQGENPNAGIQSGMNMNSLKSSEGQGTEDTNLGTSNVQVDQMHNIENVGSDVIFEAQGENPNAGIQSGMNMNSLKSSEGQGIEDTNLGTSNVQVDQMHNIENVGSDVIFEAQGENPNAGLQSGMNMNSLKSSEGLLVKETDKTPDSLEKKKSNGRSSVHKQKKSEDITKLYSRRITRSISKMSHPARGSPIPSNSNVQDDDQMYNIENGVSAVTLEAQGEDVNQGLQSRMNINSLKSKSEGLAGKRTYRSPDSSEKKEKCPRSSSVRKQKKSEDVVDFSLRRITRSISNLNK